MKAWATHMFDDGSLDAYHPVSEKEIAESGFPCTVSRLRNAS